MTATQIIAEIDRLPPEEKQAVLIHVRILEDEMIPDSFLKGMEEAERGELLEIEDRHFLAPPVA